jgi:hypothetical protein
MIAPMQGNQRQGHASELCQRIVKTSEDNHDSLSMHAKMKPSINKGFYKKMLKLVRKYERLS